MKQILELSVVNNKLRYTAFYGDGDSKSFINVQDTYPGIKVRKHQSVENVQLRELAVDWEIIKNEKKDFEGKANQQIQ